MKKLMLALLVVALAAGIAGCKAVEDKISEEISEEIVGGVTGTDVEVDGDEVTISTDEGDVTIGNTEGEMPEDFPDDFPMYDDVDVDSTSTWESDGEITYYVNLTSDDEAKDVYDWYKDALADEGWTIDSDAFFTGDSAGGLLGATKDDMTLTFSVGEESDGVAIGIILIVAGE